jgi:hypothetical protein
MIPYQFFIGHNSDFKNGAKLANDYFKTTAISRGRE